MEVANEMSCGMGGPNDMRGGQAAQSQAQQSQGPPQMMAGDPSAMMQQMNAAPNQMSQGSPYGFVNPSHMQPPHYMPQQGMPQPAAGMNPKARLQCHACGKLLEYDAGAQYVQCFSCSTMNAVQQKTQVGGRVLSMLCSMCSTTNLAPYGINYVRCGQCHTISQVSHAYRQDMPAPNLAGGHQGQPQ